MGSHGSPGANILFASSPGQVPLRTVALRDAPVYMLRQGSFAVSTVSLPTERERVGKQDIGSSVDLTVVAANTHVFFMYTWTNTCNLC
jgi:hypothetical protein